MRETSAQYVIQRSAESARPSRPAGWRRTDLTTALLSIRNGERAGGSSRGLAWVSLANVMNNLARNLNHDANLLTETCRLARFRVWREGVGISASLETRGSRFTPFWSVSATLTVMKNPRVLATPPSLRHAARINTQFILSKWINYLTCRAALIII